MTKISNLIVLNDLFQAELADSDETVLIDEADQNPLSILVFMIPGIRSDGEWVRVFRNHMDEIQTEQTWSDTPLDIRVVRGEQRLTTAHLVTRVGLAAFRKQIKQQIIDVCKKENHRTVSFVCHSMGSALFSEIVLDVKKEIGDIEIDKVIFVGSVCHTQKARNIYLKSNIFINDVGIRDILPCIAMTLNPIKYGQVGRLGFNMAYVRDRYFDNDHYTCTELYHLNQYIIPILNNQPVIEPAIDRSKIKLTQHIYVQRATWVLSSAALGFGGYGLFW